MKSTEIKPSLVTFLVICAPPLNVVIGAIITWQMLHFNLFSEIKPMFFVIIFYVIAPICLASFTAFLCNFTFPLAQTNRIALIFAVPSMLTYWLTYWFSYQLLNYPGGLDIEYLGFSALWLFILYIPVGVVLALITILLSQIGASIRILKS